MDERTLVALIHAHAALPRKIKHCFFRAPHVTDVIVLGYYEICKLKGKFHGAVVRSTPNRPVS